jgi:hypothetical protein
MKRTIELKSKICIACGTSFQPRSGAQLTCSEQCKEEAKAKGLGKKRTAKPSGGIVEHHTSSKGGKRFFNGQPVPEGKTRLGAADSKPLSAPVALPELELDLGPLEQYIKVLVQRELAASRRRGANGNLTEVVRQLVKEELASSFDKLFSK